MKPALYILVASGVLWCGGCRPDTSRDDSPEQVASDFGRLPGLREAPRPKLQEELARIVDEGGTPDLLDGEEPPEATNVAAGLANLFPPSEVRSILKASDDLFPSGEFTFNPVDLERAVRFREKYEEQRRRARQALRRPRSKFAVRYEAGFAADLSWIDVVRICARLEAFHAAGSLAADDPAAAIDSLGYVFRLAACLAAEKHPTARLEAAFVRREALAVVQAVVAHPNISRPRIRRRQLDELYVMIQAELKAWPADADAWIGDRALGMHAYELVRAGRLMDLLTPEEVERFAEEGVLAELPAVAQRTADNDELYYLETMRKIIASCKQPYYQRAAVLEAVRKDLQEKRNQPEFPVVAARLLLPDMEKGHAIQARDRADCEAWALALARGAGREPPPYRISPLTGEKYEVIREDGRIMVRDAGMPGYGRPAAVVPDLALAEVGARKSSRKVDRSRE